MEHNRTFDYQTRSLLLIIILILNTTACVAVVEMVRFFSVEKHFLLTVSTLTVIEIAFYLFCFVRTLTFLQYDVQFMVIQ